MNDGISGIIPAEVQHVSPGGILDLTLIICAPRLSFFTRDSCLGCIEDRQNRIRFVHTNFRSCNQSLDKTSFDFSNILHAMQSCAMNTRISIIPKLPMGLVI